MAVVTLRIQKLEVSDCVGAIMREYFEFGRETNAQGGVGPNWGEAEPEHKHSLILRGYGLYDGCPANCDNTLTPLDAYASVGINSRLTAYDAVRILARGDEVSSLLAGIPPDCRLESATEDEIGRASTLIALLSEAYQVNWGKATKVLHRKRPGLFPMLDSVVFDFLWKNFPHQVTWGSPPAYYLRLFKQVLLARERPIEEAKAALAKQGIDLTPVRVLDFLIWIGWRGRVDQYGFGAPIVSVWGTGTLREARLKASRTWQTSGYQRER